VPLYRHGLALLLATAAPLPSVAQAGPAAARPIRFDVERFTLPNGLTVLVHSNRRNPHVFVGIYYKVGSKDEPRGRSGFAHLFEHLMFQPTTHRGGDYLTPLLLAGARDANASTLADYTEYHQTVPTNAIDLALWLESDRMAYLAGGLSQASLDEQRAVIRNEALQSPSRASLSERRFQHDFYPAGHPYTRPVIGTMADIDAATLDEVKDWYRTWYGAGNAILVLSGDIDVATARDKATRYFADVPQGPVLPRPATMPPGTATTRHVVFNDTVPAPVITRVWPVDPAAARDMTLLQMVEQTMKVPGPASLQSALVGEGKPASSLTTAMDQQQLSTTFSVSIAVRPGVPVSEAEAALDGALARYLARGPDQARLSAIAGMTDQALLRQMQDNAAVGMQMGLGELYLGDPASLLRQRDWTAGATSLQLRQVATRWLSQPYYQQTILPGTPEPLPPARADAHSAVVVPPPPPAPLLTPMVDRSRLPEPGPFKDAVQFPAITRTVLANGLTLIVAERHDVPIVEAYLQFPTGTLADLRYVPGTVNQAFALMTAGTVHMDEAALSAARERVGMTIGGGRSARTGSFSWSTLTRNASAGFALAADMLRHPAYPQARIDAYNVAAAGRRGTYDGAPQNAAQAVLLNALWGDRPNGRLFGPDATRPVTRAMMNDFHRRELGADGATLVMMGDITPVQARRLAERHFRDWRRTHPAPTVIDTPPPVTGGRVILIDAPGSAQSVVTVGQLVPPYSPDRRAAEIVAEMTLAGDFDSRINRNLRGDKRWTYGFQGGIGDAPTGLRLFSASGSIETVHTAAAMREIQGEMTAIVATRPIDADELDGHRAAAIRTIPLALGSDAAVMQAIVRANDRGRPLDDARRAGDRLAAVTLEQVNRVARETYRPAELTWVVVGDLATIERDVRALNLGPVEVRDIYGKRQR